MVHFRQLRKNLYKCTLKNQYSKFWNRLTNNYKNTKVYILSVQVPSLTFGNKNKLFFVCFLTKPFSGLWIGNYINI